MKLRKLIRLQFTIVAVIVGLGVTAIVNAGRNSSGSYSLPSGNPVVSGTTISSTVHNATMSDVATELTDSLSRSNKGAMLGNLELVAGADLPASPALTWDGDEDTGFYRIGANNIGVAANGAKVVDVGTAGIGITGTLSTTGAATLASVSTGALSASATISAADGSAAAPSVTFTSDTDTGLYRVAADTLGVAIAGAKVGAVTSTSTILPGMATAPGGRLTLTTAVPVTQSDVTGATTLYYTPYLDNTIALYDGTNWVQQTFSEMSQATTDNTKSPAACAANSNYDVFVWNDSGTMRATRGPAWTSSTARGTGAGTTELERLGGRYVNKVAITNGPAAQRGLYVGTVRANASSQLNDAVAHRGVWNNYNRVTRNLVAVDATANWTYNTAAWRQANNAAANAVVYTTGLDEGAFFAQVTGIMQHSSAGGTAYVAIGYDSTTVYGANTSGLMQAHAATYAASAVATAVGSVGLGYHTLYWLEYGGGATTTFLGTVAGPLARAGIVAHLNM